MSRDESGVELHGAGLGPTSRLVNANPYLTLPNPNLNLHPNPNVRLRQTIATHKEEEGRAQRDLAEIVRQQKREVEAEKIVEIREEKISSLAEEVRGLKKELHELKWSNRVLVDVEAAAREAVINARKYQAMLADERQKSKQLQKRCDTAMRRN